MNNQTLPIPNPGDWATHAGAALLLDVSTATVKRMARDGRLIAYAPMGARPDQHLFWVPAVLQLVEAIARSRPATRGGDDATA